VGFSPEWCARRADPNSSEPPLVMRNAMGQPPWFSSPDRQIAPGAHLFDEAEVDQLLHDSLRGYAIQTRRQHHAAVSPPGGGTQNDLLGFGEFCRRHVRDPPGSAARAATPVNSILPSNTAKSRSNWRFPASVALAPQFVVDALLCGIRGSSRWGLDPLPESKDLWSVGADVLLNDNVGIEMDFDSLAAH